MTDHHLQRGCATVVFTEKTVIAPGAHINNFHYVTMLCSLVNVSDVQFGASRSFNKLLDDQQTKRTDREGRSGEEFKRRTAEWRATRSDALELHLRGVNSHKTSLCSP